MLKDAPPTAAGIVEEADLWETLEWFLKRVVPVAEEAGVKLALHPDDPPLSPVRGLGRIMTNVDAFQRVLELVPSEANGITLCQGNFTLMTDDLPAVIRHFGEQERIFFVHFRDVSGTPERSSRRSTRRGRPTCSRACGPTATSASAGSCAPITCPTIEGDTAEVPRVLRSRAAARDRVHQGLARGRLRPLDRLSS